MSDAPRAAAGRHRASSCSWHRGPVSWINTAYPFAAAYLLTTRQIDRDARRSAHCSSSCPTTSRCTASTTSSTTSPTCAIRARAARTARCSIGGCIGSRCGRQGCRACRSSSTSCVVGLAGVVAGAGREPVLRRLLQRAAAAAEGGAVRGLGDQQHPLLLPRRVRVSCSPAPTGRWQLARGDRRVRAVGRRLARVRCGAGCRRRPRRPGSRRSRRRAAPAGRCGSRSRCYAAAGVVDARHPLARPARGAASSCRTSRRSGRSARSPTRPRNAPRAGWRRFLWVNQLAGFVVTLLLIWRWLLTA